MHDLLMINDQYRDKIADIIARLDKKQPDYFASFSIDPKKNTLELIGGHAPEYVHVTITLPDNHQLKKMRFALDGAYFSQLLTYSGKGNAIALYLDNDNGPLPIVAIMRECDGFLRCESVSFYPAHDEFIKEIEQHAYKSVRAADILRLLLEVDMHSPFQYAEIDEDEREMRVQNDNNQTFYDIPDNVPVPLSVVLTQEAMHHLKEKCEQTKDESINIAVHDENVTLKTSDTVMTLSLAGIEEFHKNKPKRFDQVASMVMDIHRFKDDIRHFCKKYPKIKRANQAHLLIEPTELNLFNLVDIYGFKMPISSESISIAEKQLFLIPPKEIKDIRVKDFTCSDMLKIAILKGPEGDHKLGFYKNGNHKFPYASVPITPAAPEDMDKALLIKQKAQECKEIKDVETEEAKKELQEDLFGFEDI